MAERICPKCGRTLNELKFFSYRGNREKKYPICKDCIKMDIDDYNPDTFIKYIKEFNDPWSPTLWNDMLKKEEIRRKEKKGIYKYLAAYGPRISIIGKYLSYVRLKGFQAFTWEKSDQFEEGQLRIRYLSNLSSKEEG